MARGNAVTDQEFSLPSGRQVFLGVEKPSRAGAGRPRTKTEFDDVVPQWYEYCRENEGTNKEWIGIPVAGEEDAKQVMGDIRKAADFHELGCSRDYDVESGQVKVKIHDKLKRGPVGPRGGSNGEVEEAE